MVVAVVAASIVQAASASAAIPRCVSTKYYNMAFGGCSGNLTPGRDRMDIECKGARGYIAWYYSGWHNRYADWQTYVGCGVAETVVYVTFDHQG